MRFVVLLRGVNVGGINIKMAELRTVLEDAGFTDVKTVLASGNVLLTSRSTTPGTVKKSIENALSTAFGYEAWVIVLDPAVLADIVDKYPFDASVAEKQPYVVFSSDGESTRRLGALADSLDPDAERIAPGEHGVLYWEVTKGLTLDTVMGKASAKAAYKSTTTTRNVRTLIKLLA
jgi:uncharacterized protein (DUF1697 family)